MSEHTVVSKDGTSIAFERLGGGPPLIVVGGATCDRVMMRPHSEALAADFAVLNYDRRGRGASGDTAPYLVEREIEDLGVLLDEVGEEAVVYGHSSGAVLALRAAAAGLPIARLVAHEPPFTPDEDAWRQAAHTYAERLEALLAAGRRGDAVALFMALTGMSEEAVAGMRQSPAWSRLEAVAPTLAYDAAVMGNREHGATVPTEMLAAVGAETLVLVGGASPPWMVGAGHRVAAAIPIARCQVLDGEQHVVAPSLVAPIIAGFFQAV